MEKGNENVKDIVKWFLKKEIKINEIELTEKCKSWRMGFSI